MRLAVHALAWESRVRYTLHYHTADRAMMELCRYNCHGVNTIAHTMQGVVSHRHCATRPTASLTGKSHHSS